MGRRSGGGAGDRDPLLTEGLRSPGYDSDEESRASSGGRSGSLLEDPVSYKPVRGGMCYPTHWFHRYIVLALICLLSLGSYFCYDNPAALEPQILKAMDVPISQYTMLYSLYSYPNVVLCLLGGFLIDRVFGLRLGALIFASFVTLGQVIFALGAVFDKFWLMEVGRAFFGLGGESLAVAQNAYAVTWFKGRELNMVFGLTLSISRVGSTINMNVMRPIYDSFEDVTPLSRRLGLALMVGVAMCAFSLALCAGLALIDVRAERILNRKKAETGEKVNLWDVKKFPLEMWLIAAICVAYYVAIFPFVSLGTDFFISKYSLEPAAANALNSIIFIISAACSPVFGFVVDRVGRNLYWLIIAIVITLASHLLMAFTFVNPYVPMVMLGLAYSVCACALWPLVSLVIPERLLGTAYGFMQSIQNLGLAVVAQVAGIIVDKAGYLWLEIFFTGCMCVALISALLLFLVDEARDGVLNASAKEKAAAEVKRAAAAAAAAGGSGGGSPASQQRQLRTPTRSPSGDHRPRSPFDLRNRYMSRLGIPLPPTYRLTSLANPSPLK